MNGYPATLAWTSRAAQMENYVHAIGLGWRGMTGNQASSANRLMAVNTALIALAISAGGCASKTSPSLSTTTHHQGITTPRASRLMATLSLESTTVRTGGVLSGTIAVENNTGHALHASGCGGIFQVLLTSSSYHPDPAWATCLQSITIPAGSSTYPIKVEARYNICGNGGGLRPCTGSGTPLLAPGQYEATTFELGDVVPIPRPTPVDVTG